MTSLARQLESLHDATSRQLTVERKHVSLIFDEKEAKTIDRETAYKIGCTGLDQLRKLDPVFNDGDGLFDETAINFQRILLSKEENEKLSRKIRKLLFHLSPYMQHFSCQQVLEWLIYKYQIFAFDAEALMMSFLPFHETNVYGRLLSIIEFNFGSSRDWGFLEPFARKQSPVPFSALIKNTLSSTHSLLTRLTEHIENGIDIVGEQFLETKAPLLFNFYAKLLLAVLDDASKVDDSLLAKIVPLVANGLKSRLISFREASMMVVCQMAIAVKLTPNIVSAIIKLLLMKLRDTSMTSALSTLAVLCQNQSVPSFSTKAVLKVLHKFSEGGAEVWQALMDLGSLTDLRAVLKPLWTTLFEIAVDDSMSESDRKLALDAIVATGQADMLHGEQASDLLALFMLRESADDCKCANDKQFVEMIVNIVTRYSDEFSALCEEWTTRDETVLNRVIDSYKLRDLMVIQAKSETKKKRPRRRSGSTRVSTSDPVPGPSHEPPKKTAEQRASEMAAASEFFKRSIFSGDPLKKALDWIQKKDWANVAWALDEMASRTTYWKQKLEDDIEEFVVELIKLAREPPPGLPVDKLKSAIANAPLRADFVNTLLTRHELAGSAPKMAKTQKSGSGSSIRKAFENETNAEFDRRLQFVLAVFNVAPKLPVNGQILSALFEIMKEAEAGNDGQHQVFVQLLAIGIIIKMLKNPGTYKVVHGDLQMDVVVETLRATTSHHVLRDCLRLLTAAIRLSPSSVTSHVMSVFTFMGSGILRKDNELTLNIIEQTIEALFLAVIGDRTAGQPMTAVVRQRVVETVRVLAASVSDIPAHRRAHLAAAISRAIGHELTWIVTSVLLEGFCAKWQRSGDAAKKSSDQDAFEDIATDVVAHLDPVRQLSTVLDLVQFVVRLGGDEPAKKAMDPLDLTVFDRNKYTLPKLRHFRFVLIGLVVKVLSNRNLFEQLARCTDEELYEVMLPIGKRLMIASVQLDEFAAKESSVADTGTDPQTVRYWTALAQRAEIVAEKLRHLLPGGVSAKLICDVLEDKNTSCAMREKALQLLNLKLMHDGFFYSDSGINEQHLVAMGGILNGWIKPQRSSHENVLLCQNAAFSLKLVAKRIPMQSESTVLAETMDRCVKLVEEWQTLDENMVGNVLLLAGELIRSHNMRSTMVSAVPLFKICLNILTECITNHATAQKNLADDKSDAGLKKSQRVRQQSLRGKTLGSDTLLICALTCSQRIIDQFAAFVTPLVGQLIISYCRLNARFVDMDSVQPPNVSVVGGPIQSKSSIQHRLDLIRRGLQTVELRLLPAHFSSVVKEIQSEDKAMIALFSLLSGYFSMAARESVSLLRTSLMTDVFLPALDYRSRDRRAQAFEGVCAVERAVVDSLIRMADVLSEVAIRPLIGQLVRWAESALVNPLPEYSHRVRLVPLYHFANRFYAVYNSLALPYMGKLIELCPQVLRGCNTHTIAEASCLLLTGKKDTLEALEADFLVVQVIDLVSNCARHKQFFTSDRCELVSESLVDELSNTRLAGHESRCVSHLAEAFYRVGDAAPELFSDMLNKILLKTRSNKPKTRYRTLLMLYTLFEKMGDGVVPSLPAIMPFLSELLEDDNRQVEEQCEKVVRLLQNNFGENIAEGFM